MIQMPNILVMGRRLYARPSERSERLKLFVMIHSKTIEFLSSKCVLPWLLPSQRRM
jgi:hypothetical protein